MLSPFLLPCYVFLLYNQFVSGQSNNLCVFPSLLCSLQCNRFFKTVYNETLKNLSKPWKLKSVFSRCWGVHSCMSNEHCQMFGGITELVLLHNRCHMLAVNEHLDAFMRPCFIKCCGTWLNSAKPCYTADFSQRLPRGNCDSFHTWCCLATVIKTAMLRFTNRHHRNGSDWGMCFLFL